MGYDLGFAAGVEDDITGYVLTFPEHLEGAVLDQIEQHLNRLAESPGIAGPTRGARPMYVFAIEVEEIRYRLAATFCYSQDERFIVITGFRRLML